MVMEFWRYKCEDAIGVNTVWYITIDDWVDAEKLFRVYLGIVFSL